MQYDTTAKQNGHGTQTNNYIKTAVFSLLRNFYKYHLITPAWQCAKSYHTTQITNQSGINITYGHLIGLLFICISVDLYLLSIWQITAN